MRPPRKSYDGGLDSPPPRRKTPPPEDKVHLGPKRLGAALINFVVFTVIGGIVGVLGVFYTIGSLHSTHGVDDLGYFDLGIIVVVALGFGIVAVRQTLTSQKLFRDDPEP